jgi:hypothetical protein
MIADKTLCLAHEHDRQIRNPTTQPAFCPRYIDCHRHQAINLGLNGNYTVKTRACKPGQLDAYLPAQHLGKLADGDAEGSEA